MAVDFVVADAVVGTGLVVRALVACRPSLRNHRVGTAARPQRRRCVEPGSPDPVAASPVHHGGVVASPYETADDALVIPDRGRTGSVGCDHACHPCIGLLTTGATIPAEVERHVRHCPRGRAVVGRLRERAAASDDQRKRECDGNLKHDSDPRATNAIAVIVRHSSQHQTGGFARRLECASRTAPEATRISTCCRTGTPAT